MNNHATSPNGHSSAPAPAQPPASEAEEAQRELERVREIILGSGERVEPPPPPEVERLREILFGPQIERYERQLAEQRADISRLAAELRQAHGRIAELEQARARQVEALEDELHHLKAVLQSEHDRGSARDALLRQLAAQEQQSSLTQQSLASQIGELRRQLAQHEGELRAVREVIPGRLDQQDRLAQSLRRDVNQATDTLRSELRRLTERLDTQKADRRELAGMLVEIATRLETGSSVTGLLQSLTPAE